MAYKFQLGAAVLSGSIKAEDGLVATDVDDTTAANIVAQIDAGEIAISKLASSTISGVSLGSNLNSLSKATNGGVNFTSYNGSAAVSNLALDLSDLAAAAVNVGADSIAIYDADADVTGKETIADLATAMAGDGLAASSGVFAVSVDDSSIETNSDSLRVKASGITNAMLAGSIANGKLANSTISGVSLGSNLNALSKATNGGVNFSSYNGSAAVSNLALDLSDLADAAVNVGADSIAIYDADADVTGKESIADLMTAVAGNGLAASSGVLAVGVDDSSIELNSDALRVKASGVTNAMLAGSIANAKLANSAITIAGSSTSLGGSITAAAILNTDMGGAFTIGNQSDDVATFTGGLIVGGDLTVNGTTTSVNSTTINITSSFTFEGPADDHETILTAGTPTADITVTLPQYNSAGTVHMAVLADATTAAAAAVTAAEFALLDGASSVGTDALNKDDGFMHNDGGVMKHTKIEKIGDFLAGTGLGSTDGQLGLDIGGLSPLGGASVAQADEFVFDDAGTVKKITFSNLEDTIFGNVSGDATIAAGGALTIAADAVESGMLNDNVISGQTELASGLAATDEFLVSDAGTLKRMDASVLKTFIGSGTAAVNAIGDANATLAVGINAPSAASSAQRTWTLPASAALSAGESIVIKAYGNAGTNPLTIAVNSGQEIDGVEANIVLESDNAAITLYYVAADTFIIV